MSLPDPKRARVFRFLTRHYEPSSGQASLSYAFDDGPVLTERLVFPWAPWPSDASRQAAFFRALDLLHLLAGVSYYKAGVPETIDTGDLRLDDSLAAFATDVYVQGLAEFAHRNGLELDGRVRFPSGGARADIRADLALPDRALVAMGGGKDSLVSLELLRDAGIDVQPFTVGASALIGETVRASGLPLIRVERRLAPELGALNEAGAWNGHVPVTAINSAIGACAAILYGFRYVVFSNERSADEPTLHDARGRPVNHQWSKGLAFERGFHDQLQRRVAPELEYFSLLRPFSETLISHKFSYLEKYHQVFSSCNRNFHHDGPRIAGRWCGACPKCRFTALALAPRLGPNRLVEIQGADLLADPDQVDGFRELCALGAEKPFECVGTAGESRALMAALGADPAWRDHAVVRALAGEAEQALGEPVVLQGIPGGDRVGIAACDRVGPDEQTTGRAGRDEHRAGASAAGGTDEPAPGEAAGGAAVRPNWATALQSLMRLEGPHCIPDEIWSRVRG